MIRKDGIDDELLVKYLINEFEELTMSTLRENT